MLWQNVRRVWTKSEKCIKLGDKYQRQIVWNWIRLHLGWPRQNMLHVCKPFFFIKQRIIDTCVQNLIADINSSSRCMLYTNIIDLFHFNIIRWNLFRVLTKTTVVSKIRISSLNLAIDMDDIEIFWVIPEYVNFADPKLRMSITLS